MILKRCLWLGIPTKNHDIVKFCTRYTQWMQQFIHIHIHIHKCTFMYSYLLYLADVTHSVNIRIASPKTVLRSSSLSLVSLSFSQSYSTSQLSSRSQRTFSFLFILGSSSCLSRSVGSLCLTVCLSVSLSLRRSGNKSLNNTLRITWGNRRLVDCFCCLLIQISQDHSVHYRYRYIS